MKPKEGEVYPTNNYGDILILSYEHSSRVKVRFLDTGTERYVRSWHVKSGSITDPEKRDVLGVGCIGLGSYKFDNRQPSYKTAYNLWNKMLHRCYSGEGNRSSRYFGRVDVCEEWLTFSNFYEWYLLQRREDGWHLDKDILCKGLIRKIYSPNTCRFIPADLNCLLTFTNAKRGDLPCGVHRDKRRTKPTYTAQVNDGTKNIIWLGTFSSIDDAFNAYKEGKQKVIREVAEKNLSMGYICEEMYNNLLNWNIEKYPD